MNNFLFLDATKLPVPIRKLIRILIDIIVIAFALSSTAWITSKQISFNLITFSSLSGVLILAFLGLYGSLTKYVGIRNTYKLLISNFLLTNIIVLYQFILLKNFFPLNFYFGLFIILNSYTGISRIILKQILNIKIDSTYSKKSQKIVIYGAGGSGAQLEASLSLDKSYRIKFFVDDSPLLKGRNINGIYIKSPKSLNKFKNEIDRVIITQDKISRKRTREIIRNLNNMNLKFMVVPSIKNLIDGKINFDLIKKVEIEDLLGRDIVAPNKELMCRSIQGNVVCITGAGGSIGSELCKQIVNYQPKLIILIDSNEFNLYNIDLNLRDLTNKDIKVVPILGSVNNILLIEKIFTRYNIDVVFHAAAYKHVPLIEENPLEGITNNIFSSQIICKTALKFKTKKVVLISSDKAVRPTNIMGATKRVSELIFQSYASISNEKGSETCFSAVRFGNVLGSSGSVVPLFKKQILKGGPITITHPEVTRYFMTTTEAAQLVIQAGSLINEGNIFVLDMGPSLKILDLAKKMAALAGLKPILNESKLLQDNEIGITFCGLRPGEKLFEELS